MKKWEAPKLNVLGLENTKEVVNTNEPIEIAEDGRCLYYCKSCNEYFWSLSLRDPYKNHAETCPANNPGGMLPSPEEGSALPTFS